MLINSDPTTKSSPEPACGNCGVPHRRLLHHVRHRGIFLRLCTTCVLRIHPQSFCPTCFKVYPTAPSNDAVIPCNKCYSSSHSHCVSAVGPTSSPYICPLCVNPSTPIFQLKIAKKAGVSLKVMDREAVKKLLAAAKIASASMNKAAIVPKFESERRAKEAALARKRAKEALEHMAYLVVKEKEKEKQVKIEKRGNVDANYRNGILEEKGNAVGSVNKKDGSDKMLVVVNAVESSVNCVKSGLPEQDSGSLIPLNDDGSIIDADEKGGMSICAGEDDGEFLAESTNGNDFEFQASSQTQGSETQDSRSEGNSCYCGKVSVSNTSWTNFNPGRRFSSCPNSINGGCGFFVRVDPPMYLRSNAIIPGLLRRIDEIEARNAFLQKSVSNMLISIVISWMLFIAFVFVCAM